jgi:hypothetical protein
LFRKPFTRKTSWNKDDEEYLFSDGILTPVSTTPKGCILYFDGCNLGKLCSNNINVSHLSYKVVNTISDR